KLANPSPTRGVAPLGGGQVEVQRGGVRDQQVQGRQGGQGRNYLHVAATAVAGGGPVLRLLPLAVEEAQLLVVAAPAERAPQPRHLPPRGAQAAAEEPRLLQPAELAQQRPAAAGRAVAPLPGDARPQGAERFLQGGEEGEQREA